MLDRNRNRTNFINRIFFLNLRNSSVRSDNSAFYGSMADQSNRVYEFRVDTQPPNYIQAISTNYNTNYLNSGIYQDSNLVKCLTDQKNDSKPDQANSKVEWCELSVLNLENLLPSYEEAINMNQLNENTKL